MVDNDAAAEVEEQAARPHLGELLGAEQSGVPGPAVDVQGDRLGHLEQLVQRLRSGGRCPGPACRPRRRSRPACPAPRRSPTAGCRCCRSRRCRGSGRGPRGRPWPTCPRRRRASAAFLSVRCRAIEMISAMASSTTLRVLENGALKTATPSSAARGQVDLVGADAEGPDRQQVGGGVQHRRGHGRLGADAQQLHAIEGRDQLRLVECALDAARRRCRAR